MGNSISGLTTTIAVVISLAGAAIFAGFGASLWWEHKHASLPAPSAEPQGAHKARA